MSVNVFSFFFPPQTDVMFAGTSIDCVKGIASLHILIHLVKRFCLWICGKKKIHTVFKVTQSNGGTQGQDYCRLLSHFLERIGGHLERYISVFFSYLEVTSCVFVCWAEPVSATGTTRSFKD